MQAKSGSSIRKKGLLLVLVPVVFQLLFVLAMILYMVSESQRFQQTRKAKLVLQMLQKSHSTLTRSFLIFYYSPRSETIRVREIEKIIENVNKEIGWKYNPDAEGLGPELAGFAKEVVQIRDTMKALNQELTHAASYSKDEKKMYELAFSLMQLVTEARSLQDRLLHLRSRLESELPDRQKQKQEIHIILAGILITGISASIFCLFYFVTTTRARLNETARRAQAIAVGGYVEPPGDYSDEIGQLDKEIYLASKTINKARDRENAILDRSSDLICSLDAKLRITTIGETCQEFFGTSKELLIGRSILGLLAQNKREDTRNRFLAIKESGEEGKIETITISPTGESRKISWLINWSQKKDSYFCVARDVTKARNIEYLRQYFLSMAGHDLRSPLTAISMEMQLISEGIRGHVPPEVAAEVNAIEKELGSLLLFVNELLDLDKLESGSQNLELFPLSLGFVCEAVIESLEPLRSEDKSNWQKLRGDALVLADEIKLEKGISGLLSGCARIAGPEATLSVEISESEHMGVLSVSIPDIRISSKEIADFFSKFHPSSETIKFKPGLGLAVAKSVATMHGGNTGVERSSDGHTRVWMSIPAVEDFEESLTEGIDASPGIAGNAESEKSKRSAGSAFSSLSEQDNEQINEQVNMQVNELNSTNEYNEKELSSEEDPSIGNSEVDS